MTEKKTGRYGGKSYQGHRKRNERAAGIYVSIEVTLKWCNTPGRVKLSLAANIPYLRKRQTGGIGISVLLK